MTRERKWYGTMLSSLGFLHVPRVKPKRSQRMTAFLRRFQLGEKGSGGRIRDSDLDCSYSSELKVCDGFDGVVFCGGIRGGLKFPAGDKSKSGASCARRSSSQAQEESAKMADVATDGLTPECVEYEENEVRAYTPTAQQVLGRDVERSGVLSAMISEDASQSIGSSDSTMSNDSTARHVRFAEHVEVKDEMGVMSTHTTQTGTPKTDRRSGPGRPLCSARRNDKMYREAADKYADLKCIFEMFDTYTTK